MKLIKLSSDGFCASFRNCLPQAEKSSRKAYLEDTNAFYVADGRGFIEVEIDLEAPPRFRGRIYIMDAITGTLYNHDGYCLSSTQVPKRTFVRNDEQGRKQLLGFKPQQI